MIWNENYKTLVKEIENSHKYMERYPVFMDSKN
jgi:hypothetical protein